MELSDIWRAAGTFTCITVAGTGSAVAFYQSGHMVEAVVMSSLGLVGFVGVATVIKDVVSNRKALQP